MERGPAVLPPDVRVAIPILATPHLDPCPTTTFSLWVRGQIYQIQHPGAQLSRMQIRSGLLLQLSLSIRAKTPQENLVLRSVKWTVVFVGLDIIVPLPSNVIWTVEFYILAMWSCRLRDNICKCIYIYEKKMVCHCSSWYVNSFHEDSEFLSGMHPSLDHQYFDNTFSEKQKFMINHFWYIWTHTIKCCLPWILPSQMCNLGRCFFLLLASEVCLAHLLHINILMEVWLDAWHTFVYHRC